MAISFNTRVDDFMPCSMGNMREIDLALRKAQADVARMKEECDQRIAAMELRLKMAGEVHARLLAEAMERIRLLTTMAQGDQPIIQP
jgi:hypothetical protein